MWSSTPSGPLAAPAAGAITSAGYRRLALARDLVAARVRIEQTDMLVSGTVDLGREALALAQVCRQGLEDYIDAHPGFQSALHPVEPDPAAPAVVRAMIDAAARTGVGPMAAVAGAIAEWVGRRLARLSSEVIVENGGDVFIRSALPRKLLLLAESSELGGLRIALPPATAGVGIGTSSGTLGPSLSLGRADAVMAVAPSAALADAAATAIGNSVRGPRELARGIARARDLGVDGVLILADEHLGAWGHIEIVG